MSCQAAFVTPCPPLRGYGTLQRHGISTTHPDSRARNRALCYPDACKTMANELVGIVWLSLFVSASAVTTSAAFGIPLGCWLGLGRVRQSSWLSALIYTGMAAPPVVVGLLVYLLLSRRGPLGFLGWLFTPSAMILAQTLLTIPYVVGITMTTVAAVPRELVFQIRSLGASPSQTRWAILREARHGVSLAIATALGRSFSEVGAVLIVGGNVAEHTRVLTTAIVLETSKGCFGFALALAAILLALALAINLVILKLHGGRVPS